MAESGHAVNVANLKKARDMAAGWGAKYVPSNPLLSVASMTSAAEAAETSLDNVQTNTTPYRNATAACEDAFEPLGKLITRVIKTEDGVGYCGFGDRGCRHLRPKDKGRAENPGDKRRSGDAWG